MNTPSSFLRRFDLVGTILWMFAIGFTLAVVASFTGCGTVRSFLYQPVLGTNAVPAMTVTNTVMVTNVVSLPAVTNDTTGVVTPPQVLLSLQPVVTITNLPAHYEVVTNDWVKRPEVFGTADAVGSLFPGWGTAAAGIFGALGSLGAAWMRGSAKKNEAGLVGTIQGIDEIRRALQATPELKAIDKQLVDALERAQRDHGALDVVQTLIEQHTGYTTQQVDLKSLIAPKA